MLGEFKGTGKVALRCRAGAHNFELVSFVDASWAIRRDGQVIDMWEAEERESCLRTFGRLIGLKNRQDDPLIVVVREMSSQRCDRDTSLN